MSNYTEYKKMQRDIESEWGVEDTTSIFGLQAYYLKTEEMEEGESIPVKGTRHPSTRDDRRIAKKHHKRKDARYASDRDVRKAKKRSGEKGKTVLPWKKDRRLHPSRVAYSGRLNGGDRRMKNKEALQNWRAEYEGNVFVRNSSTWRWWEDDSSFLYNLLVWDEDENLWEEAWSERAEEEYWEAIDAEEWEEIRTSEEVAYYYEEEEIEVEEIPDNGEEWTEVSSVEVCGLERDDDLCPMDFAVTCGDMTFTADSEKGAAWLYDRLVPFYGDKVKFDILFSPVVTNGWEWSITVEGHTFTVIGDEGFRWLHRKLSAFYEVDFHVRLV